MKRIVSYSAVLVVAIAVWWSTTEDINDDRLTQQATGQHYIEVFMNDFHLTSMDENGKPDFTLQGANLQQFKDSTDTEIKSPIFYLLQQDNQWKISADNATLNNDEKTILLSNNVIMRQLITKSQNIEPAAIIRTQSLLIDTKTKIAKTDAPVEITRGKSLMKSIGMVYNNDNNELELTSDVNGYYLPL